MPSRVRGMPTDSGVVARGFLSYARRDNEDYAGVVDHLKRSLEGRFHAATGRQLDIFVDREAIGWGTDWRASIRDSVQSATFFIPIVTMRYFESDACREELLAFHEYASQLGVEALILPIVLTGAEGVSSDDAREEVRLIERLNYKNIEEAWLSGYESPEWLRAVHGMVNQLKEKLAAAESALASVESAAASGPPVDVDSRVDSDDADMIALGEDFALLTPATQRVQAAIASLSEATSSLGRPDMSGLAPAQRQAILVRIAHDLAAPAREVADSGAEMERTVLRTDGRLRAVADELRTINAEVAATQLSNLLGSFSALSGLRAVVGQLDGLVQAMRFAAVTNVTIRRSVEPAIRGLQSISNAVATIDSWQAI